jgi:hypothetical protein
VCAIVVASKREWTFLLKYVKTVFGSVWKLQQGAARVEQIFKLSGSKTAVVAGLVVQSGRLCNKASNASGGMKKENEGGYVFKVIRKGNDISGEIAGGVDIKRFKQAVHEVRKKERIAYCFPTL